MAQFSLTTNAAINQPPSAIGAKQIFIDYNELYVITVADVTTNTIPVYADPEGDAMENFKVLTLPTTGTLTYNSVASIIGDEYPSTGIDSGLLTFQADPGTTTQYVDAGLTFDLSDVGSSTYSGLNDGFLTFNVAAEVNQPPSVVGDGTASTAWGETIIFTRAMLTSSLTPAYSDPEGDAALNLLIQTVPGSGEMQLNGIVLGNNSVVSFSDIDDGLLTFVPNNTVIIQDDTGFTFQIADTGSGTYVG